MSKVLFLISSSLLLDNCHSNNDKSHLYFNFEKKSLLVFLENESCLVYTDDCLFPQKIDYNEKNKYHYVDGYKLFCNREKQNFRNVKINIKNLKDTIIINSTDTCISNFINTYLGTKFVKNTNESSWDSITINNFRTNNQVKYVPGSIELNNKSINTEYPFSLRDLISVFLNSNMELHDLPADVDYYPIKVIAYNKGIIIKESQGDKLGCLWKAFDTVK